MARERILANFQLDLIRNVTENKVDEASRENFGQLLGEGGWGSGLGREFGEKRLWNGVWGCGLLVALVVKLVIT